MGWSLEITDNGEVSLHTKTMETTLDHHDMARLEDLLSHIRIHVNYTGQVK